MLAALAHISVTDAAVAATCTTPGKTEGSHCSLCGTVFVTQDTIAALGHSLEVTVVDEAYCNHDGTKRYSCKNTDCGYFYDESYSISELSGDEIYAEAVKYTGILLLTDHVGDNERFVPAFVIRSDGVIVMSNEELDNSFNAIFVLGDKIYEVTEVLAYSELYGIAVLKVDAEDLPCADICAKDPIVTETVYSVGMNSLFEKSISRGIISYTEHVEEGAVYIHHDADTNEGYYGGPLINAYGEVIGINVGVFEQDEDFCRAAHISGIDALDYGTPISMEEYGKATYTPVEQLEDWVEIYGNATNGELEAYALQGKGFYYSLGYNTEDEYPMVEGYWVVEGDYQLYIRIIFDNYEGTYNYHAIFTDGTKENVTEGYIYAATYTESTVITYDTYYGRYWNESELIALYSDAVYDTLEFFSYCLDSYFLDLDIKDFGFNVLSFDRDEDALDKLNGFIETVGTLNETTGAYEFNKQSQAQNGNMFFNLIHIPESENSPASTVATINYYMSNGAVYRVDLCLDATENGNRFDVFHAIYDGADYAVQNVGWGYLDAGSFTNASSPTCYDFDGMNEYEDGLMSDYAAYLSQLMSWLNYIMSSASPELSIKDLGFLFYFD